MQYGLSKKLIKLLIKIIDLMTILPILSILSPCVITLLIGKLKRKNEERCLGPEGDEEMITSPSVTD
jgi:hypothetical protein